MIPDLSPIFADYENLRHEADALFSHIDAANPGCVTCHKGCSDCCSALFDLSLVEAMSINNAFVKTFPHGPLRSRILERTSTIDRQLTKSKRELYKAEKEGRNADDIMTLVAESRMPCPLLDENNHCLLYEERPITCRLYGIPLAIGAKSHVCGFSRFDPGKSYPTVQLAKIQHRLENMSREIARAVGSRFDLHDVYVPLSMALLTKYDDAWLGIGNAKEED